MIFRSVVSALVVAAIASAAVITGPKYTSTHAPLEYATSKFVESELDSSITTVKPADTITTVKPADKNATMKPADNIATVTPADNIATVTPADNIATVTPADNIATVTPADNIATVTPADNIATVTPEDKNATVKPADNIATVKPADNIATVKPADNNATVKPAAPAPAQAPMISCYCNLPKCLDAAGGDGTCSTRLGCYSEVQPIIPGLEEETFDILVNSSIISPLISKFVKALAVVTTEHAAAIRGSYGCLEQLHFAKQSCEEILKSMEAESSEFPIMQVPTNGVESSAANHGIHALHCCQTDRCNGNQSSPAEGSVKSAQAVLVAALKHDYGTQNSTVGVPWTPAVKSSANNVELSNAKTSINNVELSNTKTSVNNVESSNTKTSPNNVQPSNFKKNNAADLWLGHFPAAVGEPNAPSPLKSDTIFEDATTPAAPVAMPPKLSVAVPVNHDETDAHVEHVVTKRHDKQSVVPVLKQTIDDQENIADFDDDIAAEVAAAVATAKLPIITIQPPTGPPQHSGVPDFGPPPSLKKKNITTNSILATRGVNNHSNSHNNQADNNDSGSSMIGIICTIVVLCIVGLSLLMMIVVRAIIRKYDVFRNYKGVCSNPGQPCACSGGLTRRRPRTQPSSSHPDTAAAAVNRSASTAPLLPPTNTDHKTYRGHANAGASYKDSIGDTTYVLTTIPVPDHVTPVRVVRR